MKATPIHDETVLKLIRAIANWLMIQTDFEPPAPSPRAILNSYARLDAALANAADEALVT